MRKAIVALFILAFLGQTVASMRLLSASYDETAHLPAGYSYWRTGRIALNPEHPPVAKLLAALPLLVLHPRFDPLAIPGHPEAGSSAFRFGYHFLYSNDADRLLFWGRMPIVLLGLILGAYVWVWARRWFGNSAAIMATFLYVTCPEIIGHSRFVTTDIPLACFSTMALFHAWKYWLDRGGKIHLAMTGLSIGLALGSKYLAVVLPAAIVLLFFLSKVAPMQPMAETSEDSGEMRWASALLKLVAIFLIAGLVTWASFLFPKDPAFYLRGMSSVAADRTSNYPFYMLGQFKAGGWYSYFLVAFLLKTPLPTLILLLTSVLLFWKSRRTWKDETFLFVPILLYFLLVSLRAANIGVRYLMPIYPLLFIFISRLGPLTKTKRAMAFAVLLSLWQMSALPRAWPDYIGYFNELAGGPNNGPYLLDDSNIDWGQNLILLKKYVDEKNFSAIKLEVPDVTSPEYYGIKFSPIHANDWSEEPAPGVYVVGSHILVRRMLQAQQTGAPSDWLYRYEPIDRIGTGLYVYRF